ncbi:MAG: transcription antitermination factor NusG [Saprospiraceae bacterium]|jgi:transcription antitermination factor NusG
MRHKETPISTVINHLSQTEEKWFAVYTKYKCEKYVVDQLARKGISAYVPLITKTKKYKSRVKIHKVPLINSHVFVCIKKEDYIRVLQSEYVITFVKQRKNIISIPEIEINLLKMIVGEIENVEVGELTYESGDEVEIIGGNLTGIRGRLLKKEGKNSFVVQLITIGMQLAMTIDKSNLRMLKKRA